MSKATRRDKEQQAQTDWLSGALESVQALSETSEVFCAMESLRANAGGKGLARIRIIRPGFNESKSHFYSTDMLSRDKGVFEGSKMYVDHPTKTEQRERPERSVRDWVGTLRNVEVAEDGSLTAEPQIHADWLRGLLSNLKEAGAINEAHVSIRAFGKAGMAKVEGHRTMRVDALVEGTADFVTQAGAGGEVLAYESAQELGESDDTPRKDHDMTPEEISRMAALEADIVSLKASVTTITTERDAALAKVAEADAKIAEATQAQAKAAAQAVIATKVAESKLPDASKARVLAALKGLDTADGVAAIIEAEQAYVDNLTGKTPGKIEGMGSTPANESKGDPDKMEYKECFEATKTRYMADGLTEAAAVVAATAVLR